MPAIWQTTVHSRSVTGQTDSRDWRNSAIPASSELAFIAARVTGFATGLTGAISTIPSFPDLSAGSE